MSEDKSDREPGVLPGYFAVGKPEIVQLSGEPLRLVDPAGYAQIRLLKSALLSMDLFGDWAVIPSRLIDRSKPRNEVLMLRELADRLERFEDAME